MNQTRRTTVLLFCFLCVTNPSTAQWAQFSDLGGRSVLSLTANGSALFAGTNQGIYLSTSGGLAWIPRYAGLPNLAVTSFTWRGLKLFAAVGQWIFSSADSGVTWTLSSNGLTTSGINVLALKDSILFAGGYGGVFRSADNGANWTGANVGLTHGIVTCLAVHDNFLFAGGDSGICRTSNNGATWTSLGTTRDSGLTTKSVLSLTTMGAYLFAGTSRQYLPGDRDGPGGVYASTDNGVHWVERGLPLHAVYQFAVYQQTIVASTTSQAGTGIYFSQNNGAKWVSAGGGLPFSYEAVNAFLVSGTNLLAGTVWGVYSRPISELVTGVETEGPGISSNFALNQNYPNPFNPNTTISYSLPKTAVVSLRIFNTLGQEVSMLVDEQKSAGYYKVQWTANVPSGIYLYRLQSGAFVETKKMILLR